MADTVSISVGRPAGAAPAMPRTLDEARAMARERFKSRLAAGERVGDCACHDEEALAPIAAGPNGTAEPAAELTGVRFRDSGRVYYFRAEGEAGETLAVGDWVVVETSRGKEAGRVVIAPQQVRLNLLQGELKPILRRLDEADVRRMEALKRDAATAVKTFGERIRAHRLAMKPISAEYSFDGSTVVLNYSTPERERAVDHAALRELARDLARVLTCRVELRQVGPRDEARLLGGLGRCGRTLCCSSWLPVYPEISMNMAKTQDLPLNPTKVSGVCGRLLCCLSYENEQYKQMKAVMPRLGQTIETPAGPGLVVSLQILKELVTVRLAADNTEAVFATADLGLGSRLAAATPAAPAASRQPDAPRTEVVRVEATVAGDEREAVAEPAEDAAAEGDEPEAAVAAGQPNGSRRRRRRGRRSPGRPGTRAT
jgi:cell fate regulator YaaT (PSP1 superfamily)